MHQRLLSSSVARTLALAMIAFSLIPAAPTEANGTPISIVLSYLSGVSNWGPTNATGVAELVTKEGEVRMTASGLPQLQGEQYHLWVLNSSSGESMTLEAFNTENGVARLDLVLKEPIPDRGWDLLLVTIEADGARPSQPGARHAIAGRFPVPPTGQARPAELPNTGGAPVVERPTSNLSPASQDLPWPTIIGGALLALVCTGALGFRLGHRVARRQAR